MKSEYVNCFEVLEVKFLISNNFMKSNISSALKGNNNLSITKENFKKLFFWGWKGLLSYRLFAHFLAMTIIIMRSGRSIGL